MKNNSLIIKNTVTTEKIVWYSFLIVVFSQFAAFAVLFISNPNGEQLGLFFRNTDDFFADLFNVAKYTATKDPYCYTRVPIEDADRSFYLPLANMIFYFLSRFSNYSEVEQAFEASYKTVALLTSFLFIMFSAILLFALLYGISQKRLPEHKAVSFLISFALLCSGVFLFSVERGNIIILTVALVGFFLSGYKSENKIIRELAYISLALAAGLKIYPAVFGLLLLYDKKYKESIRLMIYGALAVFLPFLFFEGGFRAIPLFVENMKIYHNIYDIYLFDRLNYRYYASYGSFISNTFSVFLYSFMPAFDAVIGILSILSVPFQKEEWKKYAALVMPIMICPSNSGMYNCLYLFPVIIYFLTKKKYVKSDIVYFVLFLLTLTPLQHVVRIAHNDLIASFKLQTMIVNAATWLIFALISLEGTSQLGKAISGKLSKRTAKNKAVI